ncbi:hypothetical protein IT575_06820 [bacterium]|nr:hypothetical protein [bacterium]
MSVLDRKSAYLPLPERLWAIRERIRRQVPRAVLFGRIGAVICALLSLLVLYGIGFIFFQVSYRSQTTAPTSTVVYTVLTVQTLLALFPLLSSISLAFGLHRLYPYYYCQMLKGIHSSDYALLMSGEDIQREMDASWRERFLGMPLRGKLLTIEQHLYSSAHCFESILLYSRHQRWMRAMGRYRNPSRQVSLDVLYRWSWATGLILALSLLTGGVFLIHSSIIYAAASPQHLISSARLAALIDNYFDEPATDPALLPELPRDDRYLRRLLAPLRVSVPRLRN